jgi:hypothetical protein
MFAAGRPAWMAGKSLSEKTLDYVAGFNAAQ